jgi:hypothetical protein
MPLRHSAWSTSSCGSRSPTARKKAISSSSPCRSPAANDGIARRQADGKARPALRIETADDGGRNGACPDESKNHRDTLYCARWIRPTPHACRAPHYRLAVWPPAHRFSQCCIEWPVAVLLGRIDEKGTCQSWLQLPRRHLSPSDDSPGANAASIEPPQPAANSNSAIRPNLRPRSALPALLSHEAGSGRHARDFATAKVIVGGSAEMMRSLEKSSQFS